VPIDAPAIRFDVSHDARHVAVVRHGGIDAQIASVYDVTTRAQTWLHAPGRSLRPRILFAPDAPLVWIATQHAVEAHDTRVAGGRPSFVAVLQGGTPQLFALDYDAERTGEGGAPLSVLLMRSALRVVPMRNGHRRVASVSLCTLSTYDMRGQRGMAHTVRLDIVSSRDMCASRQVIGLASSDRLHLYSSDERCGGAWHGAVPASTGNARNAVLTSYQLDGPFAMRASTLARVQVRELTMWTCK
jgi:hypothetical protein